MRATVAAKRHDSKTRWMLGIGRDQIFPETQNDIVQQRRALPGSLGAVARTFELLPDADELLRV